MSKASAMSGRAVTVSGTPTHLSGVSLRAPRTERVSTAADGTRGDGTSSAAVQSGRTRTRVRGNAQDSAGSPEISANGRHIAHQWSGHPHKPSISADGRRVAHQGNGTGDVWVADRATGAQTEADGGTGSTVVQLSANGRFLAMDSADGPYVRDLRTGRVQRFPGIRVPAVNPGGRRPLTRDADADANPTLRGRYGGREIPVGHGSAAAGSVSAHGRSVVHSTVDADVVPGDTNGMYDVFQWRSN
ncbi:hypothetical protein ACFYSF_38545 [Streptomyces canus]|uniref:hypothetical protein n=1 Tax=Streptomyces canus TaxID=58343 RepID=UPI0036A6E004